MSITVQQLPAINASLNALSTVFILSGIAFIKNERKVAHAISMLSALVTSTLFLGCYVTYHAMKQGVVTRFAAPGVPNALSSALLYPHTPLAFATPPLVFPTAPPAFQARWARHRRIARWTFPIWLYVSVTGVLVYFMLYQWYRPV